MYFGQDSKGILDANIMLVPVLKTYDSVQIQDVQAKRRWKMLPMEGYEALVGTAEYLRFDLAQGTVTVVKHEDLDEDWGVLSVTTSDKAVKIADLSEKDVDSITFCWYNKPNEICAENGVALPGAPEGKPYG